MPIIDLSKLKTRATPSNSKTVQPKQDEKPPRPQRQRQAKAKRTDPIGESAAEPEKDPENGIKAQTKLSSMLGQPKQTNRSVYVRIVGNAIALVLIIDSAFGKERVGVQDGVVRTHNRPDALSSERAKDTRSSEIQAYSALPDQARKVVDRILCAFDGGQRMADYNDLSLEDEVKSPEVDLDVPKNEPPPEPMLNGDDDTSSESSEAPSDKVDVKEPPRQEERESDYYYDDTPLPNFPIYRRAGVSANFYELFLTSYVRNMLSSWDSEVGPKLVVVVEENETIEDYDTFVDDTLVQTWKSWKGSGLPNVHFLTSVQAVLDIALFDGYLTKQWYVGLHEDTRLMFWS